MVEKRRHASEYRSAETQRVVSACLTVVGALGDLVENVCITGGLVPGLLIDLHTESEVGEARHCGTNDLDVGLHLALLNDDTYKQISDRLRGEGFKPDVNTAGNPAPQRWRRDVLRVTIDFLIPPPPAEASSVRIKHLEGDFAAVIIPGLELAFEEREDITLEGCNLDGQQLSRTIGVCGPAAFTVLKASAFANRAAPKDAYDLIYVLSNWPAGTDDVAARLMRHRSNYAEIVDQALRQLSDDFASIDHHGPRRAAVFADLDERGEDDRAADAFGRVDDLLRACRDSGVMTDR